MDDVVRVLVTMRLDHDEEHDHVLWVVEDVLDNNTDFVVLDVTELED